MTDSDRADGSGGGGLDKLTSKLTGFISDAKNVKTSQFVCSTAALCHVDLDLAYWVWMEMFPRLWKTLAEAQRNVRGGGDGGGRGGGGGGGLALLVVPVV